MSSPAPGQVTQLLLDHSHGDAQALGRLLPLVYEELRATAGRAMVGERQDHTLSATALVHEAYLRLVDQTRVKWQHRAQFLAVAAQMMRRILVDHARRRATAKRGGDRIRMPPTAVKEACMGTEADAETDLQALDAALARLAEWDPQQARIVELRYFGGLTLEETAEVCAISVATVKREWALARAWLHRELAPEPPG
jgi:RNA polymerase sigma factor (TIGR02999 family)